MSLYKGTNKNIRRYIIMELCLNQGFAPLSQDEMIAVDGGGVNGGRVAEALAGSMLVFGGYVTTIVGVGIAVGTGGAGAVPGIALAGAGVTAIITGANLVF
jgi:hypothetical protein